MYPNLIEGESRGLGVEAALALSFAGLDARIRKYREILYKSSF